MKTTDKSQGCRQWKEEIKGKKTDIKKKGFEIMIQKQVMMMQHMYNGSSRRRRRGGERGEETILEIRIQLNFLGIKNYLKLHI